MCVVSVNVNEELLRDINPELDTMAAISKWAQQVVDLQILQMKEEVLPNCDMTPEELYHVIEQRIDFIYANG